MIEPPLENNVYIGADVFYVDISNSGEFAIASYDEGYALITKKDMIRRKEKVAKVMVLGGREVFGVAENHSMLFFNNRGTLLWRSNYEEKVVDFSFVGGDGVVLLESGEVVGVGNLKSELWRLQVGGAREVRMDPTGRYFLVISDKDVHFYMFSNRNLLWKEGFMDEIHRVFLSRGGSRTAISLKTGDFYLLNKMGRVVMEYKFKGAPLSVLNKSGNVIVGEDESIRIMNEKGTVLKNITTDGMCTSMSGGHQSEYAVCGTDRGRIYLFNSSGILWSYIHSEPVLAVNISDTGDYVIAGNKNVLIFNNLAYFLNLIKNAETRAAKYSKTPEGEKLKNMVRRMKGAYIKRDFKLILNLTNTFDSVYSTLERNNLKFAFVLSDLFSIDSISKNYLYVLSRDGVNVKVYGNVKYGVQEIKRTDRMRVLLLMLQPKHSGKIPIKIEIVAGSKKQVISFSIMADGIMRKRRVIANTNYRNLI